MSVGKSDSTRADNQPAHFILQPQPEGCDRHDTVVDGIGDHEVRLQGIRRQPAIQHWMKVAQPNVTMAGRARELDWRAVHRVAQPDEGEIQLEQSHEHVE